jgi:hypothetical protein
MSQSAFSFIAIATALTFLAMALAACASSEQPMAISESVQLAANEEPSGLAEFHGARIGPDSLRGELPSEN